MIEWNPVDVLTCLETEPAVDEEATSYRYALNRDGFVIALKIWPYDSDVWLAMRRSEQETPVLDLRMKGCRAIRYHREGSMETLDFLSFDDRAWAGVTFRDGWRLQVTPHLAVQFGHPGVG